MAFPFFRSRGHSCDVKGCILRSASIAVTSKVVSCAPASIAVTSKFVSSAPTPITVTSTTVSAVPPLAAVTSKHMGCVRCESLYLRFLLACGVSGAHYPRAAFRLARGLLFYPFLSEAKDCCTGLTPVQRAGGELTPYLSSRPASFSAALTVKMYTPPRFITYSF